MNNEEAKIHLQSAKLMLLGADGQPVSDLYYAVEKGIEALETIPKYKDTYYKGWCDGAYAVYEHLKMCEEEQEPKWIPVSERLPEHYQNILFSTKTNRVFEGRYFKDETEHQWYSFRDECFAWNNVVTAWMPLPEPYKAESEVNT